MDFISLTTISSEVRRASHGPIKFRRSQMDIFLNISSLFVGIGIILIVMILTSMGVESIFFLVITGIGLALLFRGVFILIFFKYEIEIRSKRKEIVRTIYYFGIFPKKGIISYSAIRGFEIRQYRKRDMSIKEWEFRYLVEGSLGTTSCFLGRTKKEANAVRIAKLMDKESGLKLISN